MVSEKFSTGTETTLENALPCAFLQVLQWQCTMSLMRPEIVYFAEPQRQLPSTIYNTPSTLFGGLMLRRIDRLVCRLTTLKIAICFIGPLVLQTKRALKIPDLVLPNRDQSKV